MIFVWFEPVGIRVDRASAIETVDLGSIPDRIKPQTIQISIHCFLLDVQLKGQLEASTVCGGQVGRWLLYSQDQKVPSLPCAQGYLATTILDVARIEQNFRKSRQKPNRKKAALLFQYQTLFSITFPAVLKCLKQFD